MNPNLRHLIYPFLWSLIALGSHQLASAQTEKHFQYRTIRREELAFPIFTHPTDSSAVTRINQFLQIRALQLLKGHEKDHIFEQVAIPPLAVSDGIWKLVPTIQNNTARCLSIRFEIEYVWASVAYWWEYYNFNPGNGEAFQLADLFTEAGYAAFRRLATNRRVWQIRSQIPNQKEEGDGIFARVIDEVKHDELHDFYLQGDNIYIDSENCFVKSEKFMIARTVSRFKLEEFKEHLNEYGKCIFGLNDDNIAGYHSLRLPQLFKGILADKPVTMVLDQREDRIAGTYVYDQFGIGLNLEGTLKAGVLQLTEYTKDRELTGYIEAQLDGRIITGTWKSKSHTRNYALAATQE